MVGYRDLAVQATSHRNARLGGYFGSEMEHITKCFTCGRTLFFTDEKTESNWTSLLNANLSSYEVNTI